MHRSRATAPFFGVLTALLWGANLQRLLALKDAADPVSVSVAQFHMVFWAAAGLFGLLLLTGRIGEVAVFGRRETSFLLLAATGGYGFWVLRGIALEAAGAAALPYLYAAPLAILLLSLLTSERVGGGGVIGLLLGFVGCFVLAYARADASGVVGVGPKVKALSAAACWAAFSVLARPLVREEKALPTAAIVTAVGAACLLVTCLSQGLSVFGISPGQMVGLAVAGFLTVGVMMALWLACLSAAPAARAAPYWYLGAAFGLFWAWRAGVHVRVWWALLGSVLILSALQLTSEREHGDGAISFGDIIRG